MKTLLVLFLLSFSVFASANHSVPAYQAVHQNMHQNDINRMQGMSHESHTNAECDLVCGVHAFAYHTSLILEQPILISSSVIVFTINYTSLAQPITNPPPVV